MKVCLRGKGYTKGVTELLISLWLNEYRRGDIIRGDRRVGLSSKNVEMDDIVKDC